MDNPSLYTVLAWLLAAASGVWALAICLPNLLQTLGLDFFRTGARGGPADLDPADKGELYADLYQQMIDLGFEPLGVTWERVFFVRKIESFAFVQGNEKCRAAIWRPLGGDFRVYFASQFADGAACLTTNYRRPLQQVPDYLAQGVPTTSLVQVLSEHRRGVARFLEAGRALQDCATLADIDAAKQAYHHNPAVRRLYARSNYQLFRFKLLFLAVPTLLASAIVWTRGLPMFLPWCVLLLFCITHQFYWKQAIQRASQSLTAGQKLGNLR